MRILVVEDDHEVAEYLKNGLEESGYKVDYAANGHDGLYMATSENYDLLIVDRMLPGLDGLALIKALRAAGRQVPVLVLSALGEVDDRVQGLRAGSDDYLTKPFSFSELLARIEALLRRGSIGSDVVTELKVADLEMDLLSRTVHRAGQEIDLQPREFRLLEYFMRHAGQVLTRTMLLEKVWDYHFDPQINVIDVHVSRDRKSTRLNSSHVRISYAVFCLKKKNNLSIGTITAAANLRPTEVTVSRHFALGLPFTVFFTLLAALTSYYPCDPSSRYLAHFST